MRAPISWLREFVELPADVSGRDLAAALIALGLEVETVDVEGRCGAPRLLGPLQGEQGLELRYGLRDPGAGAPRSSFSANSRSPSGSARLMLAKPTVAFAGSSVVQRTSR